MQAVQNRAVALDLIGAAHQVAQFALCSVAHRMIVLHLRAVAGESKIAVQAGGLGAESGVL